MIDELLKPGETVDTLRRSFMRNVAVDDSGCWLWRGRADVYGTFRSRPAHRVSWELHQGPIPDGLLILHGCNLPDASLEPRCGCVNPAHLRPGTPEQNAADVQRVAVRAARLKARRQQQRDDEEFDKILTTPLKYFVSEQAAEMILRIARLRGVPSSKVMEELRRGIGVTERGMAFLDDALRAAEEQAAQSSCEATP